MLFDILSIPGQTDKPVIPRGKLHPIRRHPLHSIDTNHIITIVIDAAEPLFLCNQSAFVFLDLPGFTENGLDLVDRKVGAKSGNSDIELKKYQPEIGKFADDLANFAVYTDFGIA